MKNNWSLIRPHVSEVVSAVNSIQARGYVEIDFLMPPLEPYAGREGGR